MLKLFNSQQIRSIDACTIEKQEILSIDLMERASLALFQSLCHCLTENSHIVIFAGTGNNGGDALALARMLLTKHFTVDVYLVNPYGILSADCAANKDSLERLLYVNTIRVQSDIPNIKSDSIIVDGIFGSGLNRPLSGIHSELVRRINRSGNIVYSIDMPSGLFVENNSDNDPDGIVKADVVFSFQFPKLSLLLPENGLYCSRLSILDIGLCGKCIEFEPSEYSYLESADMSVLLKKRRTFDHKGVFGHALIFSGSFGKMGAAVLAARACLRAGVGLLTVHVPNCGVDILQSSVPEAMVIADEKKHWISRVGEVSDKMTIGIGSGIGTHPDTENLLEVLFRSSSKPLVIDADALNLLAGKESMKTLIPKGSILTPHPIEFDRLIGHACHTGYDRLQYARFFAEQYSVYVILKGAYTAIVTPDKKVFFNSTGNPGMATGGSGDVLTGIIISLLAQQYSPLESALLGVFLHGLAGDFAAKSKSLYSLLPSDIIAYLGKAYMSLEKDQKKVRDYSVDS